MDEGIDKLPDRNGVKATQAKTPEKTTAIGDFDCIETFTKKGLVEIVEATRSLNAFPSGASRDLYCGYPSFGKVIDLQSDRILGIISKVLKWQNVRGNIQRRPPDEQFEMILECNDSMLERLGSNLDELAGIKKNPQTILVESCISGVAHGSSDNGVSRRAGSWNSKSNDLRSNVSARLITAKNIARPQIKFQIPVDNSSSTPFVPKLKDKPNSLKPLAVLPEYDEEGSIVSYLHPYEFELMKFKAPESQLCRKTPQKPLEISATDLVYVDTESRLHDALVELRGCTKIAVDVEHHSYRTFQGITCLVQVSTRSKDYLFDALALRESMHALNEVFTNPKIVKILHGADLDIEWLQRDLSLYIVNMFDTHQAAKALNLARLSLAYLLKHYCDIEADKTFQLADWRMRPLPQELIDYARQDTHFLIYIYECLTNDILDASNNQTNLLSTVYQRSTDICKKRYVKPTIAAEAHLDLFRKSKRSFDNRQLFALREIFKWRDSVARSEDESYGYVLPNHMMLQIAESLPREMQGILACCNPIPPLVRQNVHTLHQMILRARQQPLVKPILETDVIHRVAISNTKDYNNKLYCPHDLSHCAEFRDDLPTLLNFKVNPATEEQSRVEDNSECSNVNMSKPKVSLFEAANISEDKTVISNLKKLNSIQCISPYERYLAILPMVEKEKREEAARIEAENKKRKLCPAAPTTNTAVHIKHEPPEGVDSGVSNDADAMYSLPIKAMLKRKHAEAVTSRTLSDDISSPKPKRLKALAMVGTVEEKLRYANLEEGKKSEKKDSENSNKEPQISGSTQDADDGDDDGPPEEMPSTSLAQHEDQHEPHHQQAKYGKKHIKNKRHAFKANRKSIQSSDKPVPGTSFDYKNVDYKKFQGGAQRAEGTQLKPRFHGKGNSNKINNKKFNKLFTFSNVKGKK